MIRHRLIVSFILVLGVLSCQKQVKPAGNGNVSEEMGEVIVDAVNPETRCENHGNQTLFEDMPYVTSTGDTLYISATLSDMVDTEVEQPQTKAAPITSAPAMPASKFYTYVYTDSGKYTSVHNTSTGTDNEMYQVPIKYASSQWSFDKTYYWPTSDTQVLHFVSLGPAELVDSSYVYNLSGGSGYGWITSGTKLKGRFQSRKNDIVTNNDAVNLFDFIYGYDNQSKTTHSSSVEIKLKHACVGVKFIVGDIFGTIGSISLNNFYRNADFTIDNSGLTWSSWGFKSEFKQVFNKKVDKSNQGSGESLDNTTDASKTFMVIPQNLSTDAEMIIDMKNTLHPENLSFQKICQANPALSMDWTQYQGKIITFRVSSEKANQVSVAFDDSYSGCIKSNLKFENDGKSPIYIRACLVGNWLNKDGKVLTSWSENATNIHGLFQSDNNFPNLPTSASTSDSSNWVKGADGFYYYEKILLSGSIASQNLFNSFEVKSKPSDSEGNWNTTGSSDESMKITNFEMAILVQAVSAVNNGTSTYTKDYAKAAWGDAVENYLTTNYE